MFEFLDRLPILEWFSKILRDEWYLLNSDYHFWTFLCGGSRQPEKRGNDIRMARTALFVGSALLKTTIYADVLLASARRH